MVSPIDIGRSLIYAVLLVAILSTLWPFLPQTGTFSSLTWQMKVVVAVVTGFIIIGPGRVAWDILFDDGW